MQQVDGGFRHVIQAAGGEALFSANSKSVLIGTGGRGGRMATIYDLPTWESKAVFRNPGRVETSYSQPEFALFHGCSEVVTPAGETIRPEEDELLAYAIDDHRLARYGNVQSFAPTEDHKAFAYVAEAGPDNWELVVVDHASGDRLVLDKGSGRCTSLTWGSDDECLAYLHSEQGTVKALVLWTGLGGPRLVRHVLPPSSVPGWPEGKTFRDSMPLHVMAEGRFVGFNLDDARLDAQLTADDEKAPQIWRTSDFLLPTERASADATQAYVTNHFRWKVLSHVWDSAENRLTELPGASVGGAAIFGTEPVALVRDQSPYAALRSRMVFFYDLLAKNLSSGTQTMICDRINGRIPPAVSPTGRYVAAFEGGRWKLHDIRENTSQWLASEVPQEFVRESSSGETVGAEWLSDGRTLLLHDEIDVWRTEVDRSDAVRLTDGHARGRQYIFVEEGEDALYFRFEVRSTKNTGVAVLREGELVDLFQCDGRCGHNNSYFSRKGGRLAIPFEKHDVPTNLAVVDEQTRKVVCETSLRAGAAVAAHPKRELIAYRAPWGEQLHATLVHPKDFSPRKKYPMVVIVYDRQTHLHHVFESAESDSYQNAAWYAGKGYFVLKPDLSARSGDPGRSAVQCLDAALDAVARLGLVDMTRIGIMGASHGGYQTLMALCASDRFAAGVAVNPPTDLVTHSVDLVEFRGEPNLGHVIVDDEMELPFWEDLDRYVANSPLHLVKGMNTPLLLGIGRQDDNVNWRQSLYFFNALRALGKPAEMVLYPTAGHGFAFDEWRQRVDLFLDDSLKPRQ